MREAGMVKISPPDPDRTHLSDHCLRSCVVNDDGSVWVDQHVGAAELRRVFQRFGINPSADLMSS
jgi:hypothetical protein